MLWQKPNNHQDDRYFCKITDGPKNYLNILTQVMGFPNKIIQDIAVAVLQRNAYFTHHENILFAMLADNDYNVRLLGVNKILSIRVSKKNLDNIGRDKEADVRKFTIPKIYTNAKTYYSLSSLSLKDMHEPPALKHLLNKEIRAFQAVKRHIKLVSETSAAVAGFQNRDGLIREETRSRTLMKTFNTKKQFNA